MAKQLPLPGVTPKCARGPVIGRAHDMAPDNPYRVCITANQYRTLIGRKTPLFGPGSAMREDIGCGVFACVWDRGKNKVVKITNDKTDAIALARANRAGIKGVPKLYKAFRLRSPNTSKGPVYGMVVERLHTRGVAAKSAIYCIREFRGVTIPAKQIAAECDCAPVTWLEKNLRDRRRNRAYMCRRMAEDIPRILHDLEWEGIPLTDVHEDNIGVDARNHWKILDLGLSGQSTAARVAPTLRGARRGRYKRKRRR